MRAALAVVFTVALLLLAGCSGSSKDPTPAPTTTTTTSPRTTATTTAPVPTTNSTGNATTPPPTSTPPDPDVTVQVQCNSFNPGTVAITKGQTVKWQHQCGTHTVTVHKAGDPEGQNVHNAEPFSAGSTWYTFGESATFQVFCKYHAPMTSTVTVA